MKVHNLIVFVKSVSTEGEISAQQHDPDISLSRSFVYVNLTTPHMGAISNKEDLSGDTDHHCTAAT